MPDLEWEGMHVRAGGDLDGVCQGNLPYMDALVGELQEHLGMPGNAPVDYYYFAGDEEEVRRHCSDGVSHFLVACTSVDQEVFSLEMPMEHELVHAVHAEFGFSHAFLEEGLAEYLGDDASRPGRGEPQGSVSDAIMAVQEQDLPLGYYALAGHFVSFLNGDLGTSGMIERIDSIGPTASAAAVQAVLAVDDRGDFAGLEERYETTPKCAQASYRDAEPMCNISAPLFGQCTPNWDASADIVVDIDCSASDVLGPRQDEIWTYRTFELLNAGTYRILATAGSEEFAAGVVIKRCGGGCDSAPIELSTQGEDDFLVPEHLDLEPGRYLVRLTRPVDEPATIRVRFAGDACG